MKKKTKTKELWCNSFGDNLRKKKKYVPHLFFSILNLQYGLKS